MIINEFPSTVVSDLCLSVNRWRGSGGMLRSGCPPGLGKARGTAEGRGIHQYIIKVVVSEFLPIYVFRVENKHGRMLVSLFLRKSKDKQRSPPKQEV
jgi:hypothetical protein